MTDRREKSYESTSLRKGLKKDLKHMQRDGETYSDVIRRALVALDEKGDKQERQFKQQNRLLVRMALDMGINTDQIPNGMIADESKGDIEEQFEEGGMDAVAGFLGGGGRSDTSNEEISDVAELERQKQQAARMQAEEELGEEGELPAADSPLSGYGPDTKEKINERAKEIMAEQTATVEGWTDGFDHTSEPVNGGNH